MVILKDYLCTVIVCKRSKQQPHRSLSSELNLWAAWFWVSKACTRPALEKGYIRHLNPKLHTSTFPVSSLGSMNGTEWFPLLLQGTEQIKSWQRAVMVTFLLRPCQLNFSPWLNSVIQDSQKISICPQPSLCSSSPEHLSRLGLG